MEATADLDTMRTPQFYNRILTRNRTEWCTEEGSKENLKVVWFNLLLAE